MLSTLASNSPHFLPPECVDIVLSKLHQDNHIQTLFALLTVNKYFFRASVRRLYADPTKTLHACKNADISSSAVKLLILILRCSPAQDADVLDLRLVFSQELSQLPLAPTIDYLALIRTLAYECTLFGKYSSISQKVRSVIQLSGRAYGMRWYAALAWAVCGHRLANVRDISIPCRDVGRYCGHISKMTQMRSIRLYLYDVPCAMVEEWHPRVKESVLLDLEATRRFVCMWQTIATTTSNSRGDDANYSITDIQLTGVDASGGWWKCAPFTEQLRRLFQQMPLSIVSKVEYEEQLQWVRYRLAPETMDFSRVRTIIGNPSDVEWTVWDWPKDIPNILRLCKAVRHLDMLLPDDGTNPFAWAPAETEQTSATSIQRFEHLERLTLEIPTKAPWLHDLLVTLRSTLKFLTISSLSENYSVDLAIFHSFPELRELTLIVHRLFNSGTFRPFSRCPNLQSIELAQYAKTMKSLGHWDLHTVTDLTLHQYAMTYFEQDSLTCMGKVRRIALHDNVNIVETFPEFFLWRKEHWTLPSLEELSVSGIAAVSFPYSILNNCSSLSALTLMSYSPDVESKQVMAEFLVEAHHSSALSTSVKHLTLKFWHLHGDTLYDRLPQILPNLETMTLWVCSNIKRYQRKKIKAAFPKLQRIKCE